MKSFVVCQIITNRRSRSKSCLPLCCFAGFRVARSAGKMVSRDALKEHFSDMGATLTDAVLAKCEELCLVYSVDEEELAETWTAFSCSKSMNIDPTVEALNQMERAEFGKRKITETLQPKHQPTLVVYNTDTVQKDEFEDDILSTYSTTPKAKTVSTVRKANTPDKTSSPRANILSPASFSPLVSTPSTRYASRSNAGRALCSFGNVENASWIASPFTPIIKPIMSVPQNECYMFDTLKERAEILEKNMDRVANSILFKAGIDNPVEISGFHTETFESYGRICALGNELTFDNIMIESFDDTDVSCILPIHVKHIPKLSIFPGQVVAFKATKSPPNNVVASEVFCDGSLPFPDSSLEFADKGSLQIVIASGPYTPKDTMTYQPLTDLMEYVKKNKPHVVILIGPFIDAEHDHVKGGLMAETFETFFYKQIGYISKTLEGINTQIVLVASSREAHHHPIFPTPAYNGKKTNPNLLFVGDPCILNIDGLMIGVTSVDILHHMSKIEIFDHANSQDRMGRLSKHILLQQNFYPLYPPSEHVNMDMKLWHKYCQLPFTPHILVLPSDLRGFVKVECDSVVVNPEHLTKGYVGGTFAHLEVKSSGKWEPSCVTCKVVKI